MKHDQLEINVAECSDLRAFVEGREIYHFKAFTQTLNCRGRESWLDEHLKFTGKTNDQHKCREVL